MGASPSTPSLMMPKSSLRNNPRPPEKPRLHRFREIANPREKGVRCAANLALQGGEG